MLLKRDVVKMALAGQRPPYVPWSYRFTKEAWDLLAEHFGHNQIDSFLNNHIVELGSDIGFFENIEEDLYQDVFGVVWDRSIDKDIGNVRDVTLKEPSLKGYSFPDPLDSRFFDNIYSKIGRYSDCFRLYCIGFSLFERAWTLRGMTNIMMDFYDNPEFVQELFNAIADYNIAQIQEALKYDIDGVYFGDDWGQQQGLLMGYDCWKAFIYPVLKRMYSIVKEANKYVFIHSCGDVDELFDDLIEAGLDCFNPFQPEVMDVDRILPKYRQKLSFWGGLSIQQTLPFGSVEEVKAETLHLIELGRMGNFIISPSHSVEGDTPIENMLAFINTVNEQSKAVER